MPRSHAEAITQLPTVNIAAVILQPSFHLLVACQIKYVCSVWGQEAAREALLSLASSSLIDLDTGNGALLWCMVC